MCYIGINLNFVNIRNQMSIFVQPSCNNAFIMLFVYSGKEFVVKRTNIGNHLSNALYKDTMYYYTCG